MSLTQVGTFAIRTPNGGITTVAGTPVTAVQYQASTGNMAELLYFSISQSGSTTSAMEQVRVVRKTAGATVTAGAVGTNVFSAIRNSTGGAVSFQGVLGTTGTGVVATAEGTDGDEYLRFNFNVLSGFEENFQPEARPSIPPSGIIAIKIKSVVALTYDVEMIVREMSG